MSTLADEHMSDVALLRDVGSVDLSRTEVSDKGVSLLRTLRMYDLNLSHTGITDSSGEALARMSQLRQLNVSSTTVTDDVLDSLAHLQQLQVLGTRHTAITMKGIAKRFPIQTLRSSVEHRLNEMGKCGGGGRIFHHHTLWINTAEKRDMLLDAIEALGDDEHYAFSVGVTREFCTPEFVGRLAHSPSVIGLQLDAPTLMSDDILQLKQSTSLRFLAIFEAPLTREDVDGLCHITSLEELVLSATVALTQKEEGDSRVHVGEASTEDEFADAMFVFSCRSGAKNPGY